jgi:hypothetical protein
VKCVLICVLSCTVELVPSYLSLAWRPQGQPRHFSHLAARSAFAAHVSHAFQHNPVRSMSLYIIHSA